MGGLILGLVPARAGSKGLPGKNLARLGGRSLVERAVACGLDSRCGLVVVSTDSERCAEQARRAGAQALRRPARLARDRTPMLDVVHHAVARTEQAHGRVDTVVLLQPTAPFRTPRDVGACLRRLERSGADSVVSVVPVPEHLNPHTMMLERDGSLYFPLNPGYKYARRQDFPPAYLRNGAIYAFRRALLDRARPTLFGKHCLPYRMSQEFAVNIDGAEDLARARRLLGAWVRSAGGESRTRR